jgi:hypothetical protein
MTETQVKLGEALRDLGIERVGHGSEAWVTAAVAIIEMLAETRTEFTTDDVWDFMAASPPEPRAMGAAMSRARSLGYCEANNRTVPSNRPECHRRPIRVWRSLR